MKQSIISFITLLFVFPLAVQAENWLTASGQTNQVKPSEYQPIYQLNSGFDAVIRGQNPQTFDVAPGGAQPGFYDPNAPVAPPYGGGLSTPYGGPAPLGHDPFTSSPYAAEPLGNPYGHGVVGPQPVRFGWSTQWDSAFISKASMGTGGSVMVSEMDWRMDYVTQGSQGSTWKLSPEFNYTNLNFRAPLIPTLKDNYYRFAYRMETTSSQQGPLSWRLGFTPAIVTDMQSSLNSGGWNFDADATLYYRSDPRFLWVGGVSYWDRASDFILPNAGVVWTPNQFWEVRAVFPKPRVDVFIGSPMGIPTWLYAGAEYDVKSWQSGELPARGQIQMEEWRAFAGARWESGYWQANMDFGYAFNRKYNLDYGITSDLAPDDAFMMRYGFRY
ncbi:MAG: hypothetical protein JKY95_08715 [Planctomycetaceae bacterium]|nr:hypothetical protein [Planctomycetaceae bacterium]